MNKMKITIMIISLSTLGTLDTLNKKYIIIN